MAYTAPPPVLNDTAPPVNLMQQWFHFSGTSAVPVRATSTSTPSGTQTVQPAVPAVDVSSAVPVIFSAVFLIWVLFTLIAIYHWMRYRHKSWFAVPMIAVHLFISGSIILFMISGLK